MQAGIEWGYRRKYKMAKIHSYRLTNRLIKLEMTLISVTGKLIIRAVGPCDQNANISHTHTHTHTHALPALWLQLAGTDWFLLEGCHMLGYWKVCGHCANLFDLLVLPSLE